MDLISVVDKNYLECLNQNPKCALENALFQTNRDLFLESESDPELLIKIAFQQPVDVTGISICCRKEDIDANQSPQKIKLFVNYPDMGFADTELATAAQEFSITKEQAEKGSEVPVKLVKFRRINHLSLFVESNWGCSDKTRISNLCLMGLCPEVMDMNKWKPTQNEESK